MKTWITSKGQKVYQLGDLRSNMYLIANKGGYILVGDTMFGIFGESIYPPYIADIKEMIKSWGKLLNTGCSIFLPGHGRAIKRACVIKQYNKHH